MTNQQLIETYLMKQIVFERYEVNGNNFIILDTRFNYFELSDVNNLGRRLCNNNILKSDNLLILQNSDIADIKLIIIAPDGSESDMCGNGIRSVALYYFNTYGIKELKIEVNYGYVTTKYYSDGIEINVGELKDPIIYFGNKLNYEKITDKIYKTNLLGNDVYLLNVGEPHAVIIKNNNKINLKNYLNILKNSAYFKYGINLNLVEHINSNIIINQTLERGLWDFTSNCSTGSISSSIIVKKVLGLDYSNFIVRNKVGIQNIKLTKEGIKSFSTVNKLFSGKLDVRDL